MNTDENQGGENTNGAEGAEDVNTGGTRIAPEEDVNINLQHGQVEDDDDDVDLGDCPLHNEGFDVHTDDECEDFDQFISLASMCRDEQMFASFFEEMTTHRQERAATGRS